MKAALVTLKTTETFTQTIGMLQKACKRCLQQPGMVQQLQLPIYDIHMINFQDLTHEDLASTPPKLAVGMTTVLVTVTGQGETP